MRKFYSFPSEDIEAFKLKLLALADSFEHFCYLDSNNYPNYPYSTFGSFFAIDALEIISVNKNCLAQFEKFKQQNQDWLFGFLSYDLKNEIETVFALPSYRTTTITDNIQHPILHFFVPKYLVKIENDKIEIGVRNKNDLVEFKKIFEQTTTSTYIVQQKIATLKQRFSKENYLQCIHQIKKHIQQGDIYEMNFCQEFFAENISINPTKIFKKLNAISQAPFTTFFKNENKYVLCASPERFLKRHNNTLISQPIKGTRKRIADDKLDNQIKQNLYFDEKERSENVMIVDLVRNDFSKIAIKNSVEVEELFGIYSFEQVHQMISTISCKIEPNTSFSKIMNAMFPMGSMTGAPKIAAMQLIEKYEQYNRGLFSGAVGYITPKGNFDFNVVIRSIFYNAKNKYVSVKAGSAITIDCHAENEYDECLLKARAMFEALSDESDN